MSKERSNFSDQNISNKSFVKQNLTGKKLLRANLSSADFTNAILNYADFTNADLTKADLTRANLSGTNLIGTNLCEANLTEAHFLNTNLPRANFSGANLVGAKVDFGIDFTFATFSNAVCIGLYIYKNVSSDHILNVLSTKGAIIQPEDLLPAIEDGRVSVRVGEMAAKSLQVLAQDPAKKDEVLKARYKKAAEDVMVYVDKPKEFLRHRGAVGIFSKLGLPVEIGCEIMSYITEKEDLKNTAEVSKTEITLPGYTSSEGVKRPCQNKEELRQTYAQMVVEQKAQQASPTRIP